MSGERSLAVLIASMEPVLHSDEYVFCTLVGEPQSVISVPYLMKFKEKEGITLIVKRSDAERFDVAFTYPCKMITLNVHSSLEAIGFLAELTRHLASAGISVNTVSAFHHDHLFVPLDKAKTALVLLEQLSKEASAAEVKTYLKIRTVYFKTVDMPQAVAFWQSFLGQEPRKKSEKYCEFRLGNINLGLVLNDFGDQFSGSNCCPVFEFSDDQVQVYIKRAKVLGAKVIVDGLNDSNIKGVVFADPWGNEFEVTKFHH